MGKRKIKAELLPEACKSIDKTIVKAYSTNNITEVMDTLGYRPQIDLSGQWRNNNIIITTTDGQKLYANTETDYVSYSSHNGIKRYKIILGTIVNGQKYYRDILLESIDCILIPQN